MEYYVGIDVGGTNIKYGLINEEGKILEKGKRKTSSQGAIIIENIEDIIVSYQATCDIKLVGVCVPGIVEKNGFLRTGGAIEDFYSYPLGERLAAHINVPIFIENDVNCIALAEKWRGNGKDCSSFLCVAVGTGIGGAIVIDNKLFKGAHYMAGEFGSMIVDKIYQNNTAQAALSAKGAVGMGLVNYYEPDPQDAKQLNGKVIFELAAKGDRRAVEAVESFYHFLGVGILNLSVIIDPEKILIGGAISNKPGFIEEVNRRIHKLKDQHVGMQNVVLPVVEACYFNNDAGILGAVYQALKLMRLP